MEDAPDKDSFMAAQLSNSAAPSATLGVVPADALSDDMVCLTPMLPHVSVCCSLG